MRKILYLLAGGGSSRFGKDKLNMKAGDETIFSYILKKLISYELFSVIVVVADEEKRQFIKQENIPNLYLAEPGETRFESVKNAFDTVTPGVNDIVLIHDAARPNVKKWLVRRVMDITERHGNCFPATVVTDTIRRKNEAGTETIDRDDLFAIQTPQGFSGEILQDIITYNSEMSNVTDEGVILEAMGREPHIADGDRLNFKITVLADYKAFLELSGNI